MSVWEVVTPQLHVIKTKKPVKTLKKLLKNTGSVAVRPPGQYIYYYLSSYDFEQLKKGENVIIPTTLTPFAFKKGITEAWGKAKISPNFFN